MRKVTRRWLSKLAVAAMLASGGCDSHSNYNALQEYKRLEQQANGSSATYSITVIPAALSADDADELSNKLASHGVKDDLIKILKFASLYKKAKREPAMAILELLNEEAAKKLVATMKTRDKIQNDLDNIDYDEGLALRHDVENLRNMSDCEIAVALGRFVPLTGNQFCKVYDSGILDLLPFPSSEIGMASRILSKEMLAARILAKENLAKIPRTALRKIPRIAATMEKFAARRAMLAKDIEINMKQENFLAEQLLQFAWNVGVSFSSSTE